jgi:hypothetical protein
MATCPICGDLLAQGAQVCALCGTNLAAGADTDLDFSPSAQEFDEGLKWDTLDDGPAKPAPEPAPFPMAVPVSAAAPPAPVPAPAPQAPGSRCLVLYGADRKALHYFPVAKDVSLIGRLDPLRGTFPDIDLGVWLDEASARRISRKHALVFHTRAGDRFFLRPLAGNTGTQIEQDMVEPLHDYPLTPGTRLILGGVARFKFEIVS